MVVALIFIVVCICVANGQACDNRPAYCKCENQNNTLLWKCDINHDEIFDFNEDYIKNVSHLFISGNNSLFGITQINTSLPMLKTLDVDGHSSDISITESAINNFPNLETLRIHRCSLTYITPGAFRYLHSLVKLELSDNSFLDIEHIENGLKDLNATGLEIFNMSGSHNGENMDNVAVTKKLLKPLFLTTVKVFDISWTRIRSLEASLHLLPHLEYVILTGTPLFGLSACVNTLFELKNLTTVVMDYWPFAPRDYDSKIVSEPSEFIFKRDAHWECNGKDIVAEDECLDLGLSMRTFQIRFVNGNMFYPSLLEDICLKENNILNFIASHITIKKSFGVIRGLNKLKLLDMSYPILTFKTYVQPYNAFYDMPSLEILLLAGSYLNRLNLTHMETLFSKNSKISWLDISQNNLQTLPNQIFVHNPILEYLDISWNNLTAFTVNLSMNTKIKMIDLQNNRLKHLDPIVIETLSNIGNAALLLNKNDLICDCDIIPIVTTRNMSLAFYCHYKTEQIFIDIAHNTSIDNLLECDDILQPEQNHVTRISIYVSVPTVVVFIITLFLVVYLRRRKSHQSRHKNQTAVSNAVTLISLPIRETHRQNQPKFVAFLAYSYADTRFVFDRIYPLLTEKLKAALPNHRTDSLLLVHDKHFLPGSDIDETIESAIVESYVTIAVISEDFLTSHWCRFEIKMSQVSNVPIIPLYLNKCDPSKFTGELKLMYYSKVRLLWPTQNNLDDASLDEGEREIIDVLCASILAYVGRCGKTDDKIDENMTE